MGAIRWDKVIFASAILSSQLGASSSLAQRLATLSLVAEIEAEEADDIVDAAKDAERRGELDFFHIDMAA